METIHSIGLCLLVFFVIPSLDPLLGCLLTTNVAVIPSILKTFNQAPPADTAYLHNTGPSSSNPDHHTRLPVRVLKVSLNMLCAFAQIVVVVLWTLRVQSKMDDLVLTILLPLSLVFISISWWQNFVQTETILGKISKRIRDQHVRIELLTSLWKTIVTLTVPAVLFAVGGEDCARTFFFKGSLGTNCSVFGNINLTDSRPPPGTACHVDFPLIVAAVNILCSALCYNIARACCKVRAQIPCFSLPLVLSTPATFGFLVLSYSSRNQNRVFMQCDFAWVPPIADMSAALRGFTEDFWIPVAVVSYLALLYLTGHIWTPRDERLARTSK